MQTQKGIQGHKQPNCPLSAPWPGVRRRDGQEDLGPVTEAWKLLAGLRASLCSVSRGAKLVGSSQTSGPRAPRGARLQRNSPASRVEGRDRAGVLAREMPLTPVLGNRAPPGSLSRPSFAPDAGLCVCCRGILASAGV
ncbi:mothers against decapentaplegic-like protein 9 [Platysternon megacephalum]|uniref:Mothers against decapentaplegic-like protein 9 n=1 Tax=Platysternon megacephalum TaxID=55544 RepID=A0A4D9E8Z6_9SAUR|nr:mothers against decapentaplegic-like protein 9 [Platysternon megacephalum]